jgi:hypothetical protein
MVLSSSTNFGTCLSPYKPTETSPYYEDSKGGFSVYDEDSLGAFRGLLFGLVLGTAIWVMLIAAFIWYIHIF